MNNHGIILISISIKHSSYGSLSLELAFAFKFVSLSNQALDLLKCARWISSHKSPDQEMLLFALHEIVIVLVCAKVRSLCSMITIDFGPIGV